MRKGYLSHRRPAKDQASLRISSLARTFAARRHVVNSGKKRMSVAQMGDCSCAICKQYVDLFIRERFQASIGYLCKKGLLLDLNWLDAEQICSRRHPNTYFLILQRK